MIDKFNISSTQQYTYAAKNERKVKGSATKSSSDMRLPLDTVTHLSFMFETVRADFRHSYRKMLEQRHGL